MKTISYGPDEKIDHIRKTKRIRIDEIAYSFFLLFKDIDQPIYRSRALNTLRGVSSSFDAVVPLDHKAYGILKHASYQRLKKALFLFVSLGYLSVVKVRSSYRITRNEKTDDLKSHAFKKDYDIFVMPEDDEIFLAKYLNKENDISTETKHKTTKTIKPPKVSHPKSDPDTFKRLFDDHRFVSKREAETFYKRFKQGDAKASAFQKRHLKNQETLEAYRKAYNDQYTKKRQIEEKDFLDHILKDIDPHINLDYKQREVVLRDEDYTLVVAGAGAGKTTTVAAKVKYLVERQHIDPREILIVSYTNDAVNELKDRINKRLNIPAIITTFHKTGFAIIRKNKDAEKIKVAHDGIIFNVIRDYLHKQLIKKPEDLRSLILFFGYYIDAPASSESLEGFIHHFQRNDFTTFKTNIEETTRIAIDQKAAQKKTIKHEVMRSLEEVRIANFLYLNSIEYEYEAAYPYHIEGSKSLYTPDFTIKQNGKKIYLEHFGISESGEHSRYSPQELETYKKHVRDKILLHREKGTTLIYTFSTYRDKRSMLEHLKDLLEKKNIHMIERPIKDVFKKIAYDETSKYFNKFIMLIQDFVSSFKINGYSEADFDALYQKTNNVRTRLFLKLCKPIYLHYQTFLNEHDMIDFEDMINDSARLLSDPKMKSWIPNFKYAIVDEYQDISKQRFDLTKALSKLTKAKIIAVGDDWQSIFAFAGSRVDLFLEFKKTMGYADYLTIDHTYRNAQEVIDIAGSFIQKNENQLKKQLKSPKRIDRPIILYEYSDIVYKNEIKGYKGIIHEKVKLLEKIVGEILKDTPEKQHILLLGRYNFELRQLHQSGFFFPSKTEVIRLKKYPKIKLKFMTIHASKGLGFDHVILLNGSDEIFGFPSQIEMDPLLKLVKYDDQNISFAEERRLFYVALTRTKNRVHILYPTSKPSSFVKEIAREYDLVDHPKQIQDKIPLQDRKDKRCPICGYPLQFKKNHAYGLKLFMCTNEPELCGYMTNNLRSGKESISKCPMCKTGFLIVKHSRKQDSVFFGCTNYKTDGTGCNHTLPIKKTYLS